MNIDYSNWSVKESILFWATNIYLFVKKPPTTSALMVIFEGLNMLLIPCD